MDLLRLFFVLSLALSPSFAGATPKTKNLSLAQEAEIYEFAFEELGTQIREIPEAWRVIAERHGVPELKKRIQAELDSQAKPAKQDDTSSGYLEVKVGPYDEMY